MKLNGLIALVAWVVSSVSFAAETAFPLSPDLSITPGSLCENGNTYRYPERVRYCSRSVGGALKKEVMDNYDRLLGYKVTQMERSLFKIDHYIPLCMGGSNDETNLWPQHKSVYEQTDRLEQIACDQMAKGRIKQQEAIQYIRDAKSDPQNASAIIATVEAL
jgi:hypothetical protein